MQAGDLKNKIGFYAPVTSDDGYGNTTSGFGPDPTYSVRANVRPKLGGESVLAGRLTGTNLVNITVRQSGNTRTVTTAWMVKDERSGVFYNVRSIIDPNEGNSDAGAWLEMLCEKGVANEATVSGEDTTPPTITSSASISLAENAALSFTLTANESVTWAKTGGADASLFSLSGSTLSLTAKDYESPSDANADNAYVVQVTATDGSGNSTNQTITVTVTDVDEVAPTITSASTINLAENSALSFTLTANESVTWTKTGGADAGLFTLTGSTLSLTAKDFETPADADANNSYVVQVTATDGAGNATNQTITVTVIDVDEIAPTITSSNAISQSENSDLSFTLTADEAVTWTKTGGADAALFSLSGSTLSLTARDYEIPSDANSDNAYVVQVTATDAAGNATNQTITVTITDVAEGGGTDGEIIGFPFGLTKSSGGGGGGDTTGEMFGFPFGLTKAA